MSLLSRKSCILFNSFFSIVIKTSTLGLTEIRTYAWDKYVTQGSQHFIRHCKSSSIKERSDPNAITMFNIHIEYKVKCDICWKEYDN